MAAISGEKWRSERNGARESSAIMKMAWHQRGGMKIMAKNNGVMAKAVNENNGNNVSAAYQRGNNGNNKHRRK
jgi:hypothetical protein